MITKKVRHYIRLLCMTRRQIWAPPPLKSYFYHRALYSTVH